MITVQLPMLTNWLIPRAALTAALLGSLLAMPVSLCAATGGFSATLSAQQKSATGLDTLSGEQRTELDRLISAEVTEARKQEASEFAGTFVSRRSEEERKAAGLDQLTAEQATRLNALVAAAVAASPKPRERPRIKESDVLNPPRKPEIHGEVSLTYGRGSGGSEFRAASMFVDYFDPNSGFGLSVGITQAKGNGFYGFYPDYGYYGSPFYRPGFGYSTLPYRSFARDYDWYDDDGFGYRPAADWNSSYYRGFRRR